MLQLQVFKKLKEKNKNIFIFKKKDVASAFNNFGVYGVTCVSSLLTNDGSDTTDATKLGGYKYVCTFS